MPERRRPAHRTVALARDIIEIVAILAAGAWAIYTFVYEQRILPANQPPSLLLTGSLQRIGERGGMVQMAYRATLRNTGHVRVYVIAMSFAGLGLRYTSKGVPSTVHPVPGATEYMRSARVVSSTTVYRAQELTRYVDPRYTLGYEIDPGEQIPFSDIFLVRKGAFDTVTLEGSVAYSKFEREYPTTVTVMPNGVTHFVNAARRQGYDNLDVTLDRATLW